MIGEDYRTRQEPRLLYCYVVMNKGRGRNSLWGCNTLTVSLFRTAAGGASLSLSASVSLFLWQRPRQRHTLYLCFSASIPLSVSLSLSLHLPVCPLVNIGLPLNLAFDDVSCCLVVVYLLLVTSTASDCENLSTRFPVLCVSMPVLRFVFSHRRTCASSIFV